MRTPEQWHDTFMRIAEAIAERSKDDDAQVGAVIASADKRLVAMGYNGPARTYVDSAVPWQTPEKGRWIVHAEVNALFYAVAAKPHMDLGGHTLYCTGRPCPACALLIAHLNVSHVVCGPSPHKDWELSRRLLDAGGVIVERYGEWKD